MLSHSTLIDAAAHAAIIRDRLIRLAEVKERVGLGKTRIYEMIKLGEFPAPCKPGGSASRWSEIEVLTWVSDCSSQRLH